MHVYQLRSYGSQVRAPEIEALLEDINDVMSTYRPESDISRFNASTNTSFSTFSG